MFRDFFRRDSTSPVDSQIDAVMEEMTNITPGSEEYQTLVEILERLNKIKTQSRQSPVSRDTIAIVAGNILIALVVVGFEQKHVLTTKVQSWVVRPKAD